MPQLPRCFLTDECHGDLHCEHLFVCREAVYAQQRLKVARESLESHREILQSQTANPTASEIATRAAEATAHARTDASTRRALDGRAHALAATRGTPFERGRLRAHQTTLRPRMAELESGPYPHS